MVQRFASLFGSPDKHAQVVQHLLLSGKAVETFGAQCAFHFAFLCRLSAACGI
jgi:hypothetical protein